MHERMIHHTLLYLASGQVDCCWNHTIPTKRMDDWMKLELDNSNEVNG